MAGKNYFFESIKVRKGNSSTKNIPSSLYLFYLILIFYCMPHYHQSGKIPHKRHTQFRKPDGTLYSEQLFSTEGFSDDYALLYHCHPPTRIIQTDDAIDVAPKVAEEKMLKHRSFEG